MSTSEVHASRWNLVELAVAGDGIGEVDDVEDLEAPKRVICTARLP